MKYLLLMTVYFLSVSHLALAQEGPTLTSMHLQSNVRSINQTTVYARQQGTHFPKGDTASTEQISFNQKGQLTKKIFEDSPNRIFRDIYTYNNHGRLKDHKT